MGSSSSLPEAKLKAELQTDKNKIGNFGTINNSSAQYFQRKNESQATTEVNAYNNVMFPIGFCDHIDLDKYNQLYNRLDFLEKKIAIQQKVRSIRLKQQQTVDVPQALNEAARRGIFTNPKLYNVTGNNNQNSLAHESIFTSSSKIQGTFQIVGSPQNCSTTQVRQRREKPQCERAQYKNYMQKSTPVFFTAQDQ